MGSGDPQFLSSPCFSRQPLAWVSCAPWKLLRAGTSCPKAFSCWQLLPSPGALRHWLCCGPCYQINLGFSAVPRGFRPTTTEPRGSGTCRAARELQGGHKEHFPTLPSSGPRMELMAFPPVLLCSWWPQSGEDLNDPVPPPGALPVLESSKAEAARGPLIMSLLFQLKPAFP